ncbi:glycosyl hydrolase family 61-domain-containing protein [Emericellopsis atlantica]|uniref:lytic cellulose monooxygenase (C4-dehydrogenating) n=1 Tax=Emericellopsis atlantica TaxID=2614577 RepID=A0A9P7ZV56_9HYPO|nr:glycosyl hydrolase family 61-domain-containing protein [Emericellopsis atlantica]KAG9258909.1 glycosyl hydrolase family 61-domain-containing protein [Emericellopsis atlantica]
MQFSLVALAALVPYVSAHYFFDVLVIDGQETSPNQYIRSNTRPEKYNPTKWINTRDDMTPDMTDFRCNKGAFESAGQTETATVQAGSTLAMKLGVQATMQHPGPAQVYMSKAPSTAQEYEGDGDWFMIFQEGVCNPDADFTKDAWCTWDKDRIEFTIPSDLPDGEYLIRAEHIGLHGAHVGEAEFYYASCAQVSVTGGGDGVPGPTIQFPGGYKQDDESFNFSLWSGYREYPLPGPGVWTEGDSAFSNPSYDTCRRASRRAHRSVYHRTYHGSYRSSYRRARQRAR